MDAIKWDEVYLKLYAYTDQLVKNLSWFRGQTDSFLKGKQVEDYVCEAIEKYLAAPEKFNPDKGRSLTNYLKLHIIRTLVFNDVKSVENQNTSDVLSHTWDSDDESAELYFEKILPGVASTFDENIDYKKVMGEIMEELENDEMAKLIFNEVRVNGMARREFIKEHQVSEKDFDNAMKRLKTVLKNIAKQYDYE